MRKNDLERLLVAILSTECGTGTINQLKREAASRHPPLQLFELLASAFCQGAESKSDARGVAKAVSMNRVLLLMLSAAALTAVPQIGEAQDLTPVAALKNQLESKVPSNWQMHVRWREGTLLASFMPPYQEAFDLWYQPEALLQKMRDLCPEPGDRIWQVLRADQDIVMEPTVGGKTAIEMRVRCRKWTQERN